YRNAEKKLAREQRKLSRCEKGSRNYQKQKKKVALYHEKIKNQRKDFQHKLSHSLAEDYDADCISEKGYRITDTVSSFPCLDISWKNVENI
uniref:transposase n=1 Tax=Blautia wexlerae TaxID=418240 RepID=UPI0022E929C4